MPNFSLNKEQQKAFNRLRRAHSDCLKHGVYFANLYGTLLAFDSAEVEEYTDEGFLSFGSNEDRAHKYNDCHISPKSELNLDCNEWADDCIDHYIVVTEEYDSHQP